jgi:GT2 family glycosyltransferase
MVRSVLDNTYVPFELLIADASDGALFECDDPRVRVIPEPVPLGAPRGFNVLYRHARGTWVCWLNDDLEIPKGWGEALETSLHEHPEVDLFCLPVIERGDPAALILLYLGIPYACMGVMRREVGDAIGWLDEGYRFYATDPDIALRTVEAGHRLAPAIGAHVYHHHLEDEGRSSNREAFDQDNARLNRLWHPKRRALRRRYRRTSYRYFKDLNTRRSTVYGCEALEVPTGVEAGPARAPRPHRVKAWGWWLGI